VAGVAGFVKPALPLPAGRLSADRFIKFIKLEYKIPPLGEVVVPDSSG